MSEEIELQSISLELTNVTFSGGEGWGGESLFLN